MIKVNITIFFLLLYSLFTTYFAQITISADYYVSSSSGDDKNTGLDEDNPWKTITKVNSSLPAGKKVVFKRGDFFNRIVKVKTGCTYGAYGTGNKPKFGNSSITTDFFDVGVDNITIDNIEIESTRWVTIQNANYLTISNCYFHHYVKDGALDADATHSSNIPLYVNNSDYFILRDSDIRGNYYSEYQDMIYIIGSSQYSLIEGNYIDGGSHQSLYFRGSFKDENDTAYNNDSPNHFIVRNNHFYNHSHHNLATNVGAWMFLIEGNYFERAGTGIDSAAYYNKYTDDNGNVKGSSLGSAIYPFGNGIIRNNIIRRAGVVNSETYVSNRAVFGQSYYAGSIRSEAFDQAVYNNVFWDNWGEGFRTGVYLHLAYGFADDLRYDNMSFVNNTFGGVKNPTDEDFYIYKANTSQDYLGDYRNNSFEKPMIRYGHGGYTAMTIADFNLSPPGNITARDNLHTAPNFVSPNLIPNDGDVSAAFSYFEPQPNSQLIDTGDFLTFTINSGSNSNNIKVIDSKFFIDGWGIVDGDNIQLGNEIVKITSINYSTNTLIIDRNISWSNSTGVALPYSGQKPDIGAVEFNGNTTQNTSTYLTPIIIQQPENKIANTNTNIIFLTNATCDDEIGYQWWKYPFVNVSESKISNTSKFSGATTNTLTINNVSSGDNNTKYVCEIYNTEDPSNRWINSEITTLTVTLNSIDSNFETPIITRQPKSTNVNEGENVIFTIEATCDDEIGYQWWESPFVSESESKVSNNSKYSGAISNQLTISNVQETDTDVSYVCEVYNKSDRTNLQINSDAAKLTVASNSQSTNSSSPLITKQPKSTNVNVDENAIFNVEATCDDEIGYQWWESPFVSESESKVLDNSKYSGATSNQLIITNVQETDANISYFCEVYNESDRTNLQINSDIVGLTVVNNITPNLPSEIIIFLEGSFQNSGMVSLLQKNGYLPKVQPYNFSPFNYSELQSADTFSNNIVDWLLLELRSDEQTTVKQFAALLRNDGVVLNTLRTQDFTNQNIEDGNYYLVIHHRNHLSVMSQTKILIENSVINYNFSASAEKSFGTNSMTELGNGKFAMYSGNGDGNNIISNLDFGTVANNIFSTGYESGDIDMNGVINVLDYSNINKNISVKSHVP